MSRRSLIAHEFVDAIPTELSEGVLYISLKYDTAVHRCCCGCRNEVVTPLDPDDWSLSYNGETVSLDPSIGNWSFQCQSHYWIHGGSVRWARQWTMAAIEAGRKRSAQSREFGSASRIKSHREGARTATVTSRLQHLFWLLSKRR